MEAPVGYKELVEVLAKVGRRFQEEGYWVKRLGRPIPILIHDLEYIQCTLDATAYANPNGEAEDFLFGNWETDVPTKRSASTDPIRDSVMQMMKDAMERFGDKGFMEQIHTAGLDGPRPNINSLKKLIYGDKQK